MGCRNEIARYVELSTKLREENHVLKALKETEEQLRNNPNPEVVEIEDVEESSDVSDEEAANIFLRNRNDNGARPKQQFKCNVCNFVAKGETLLRGHMSMHQPESGNYENGYLNHKDGYTCNRCGEVVKTMGLIKRHMKAKHNINISSTPPVIDGAQSLPKEGVQIKCDRCNFRAETKEQLVKHLDDQHTNQSQVKCNVCKMVAVNQVHLNNHMKTHNNQNEQRQNNNNYRNPGNDRSDNNWGQNYQNSGNNQAQICRFWLRGNCYRGMQCRFEHRTMENAPIMCRDGDYCLFWPRCKYAHGEMCRFQDRCVRTDCPFMHKNEDFLENRQNIPAPNIHSYQDFPQFPQNMGRRW